MSTRDNIEKLRSELQASIEKTALDELTKREIVMLSQRLDREISRLYSEVSEAEKR